MPHAFQEVATPPGLEFQQHYSVQQVAKLWCLGEDKVRELFRDEDGVLTIGNDESRFKRGYITLRISESAIRRVHAKLRTRVN